LKNGRQAAYGWFGACWAYDL